VTASSFAILPEVLRSALPDLARLTHANVRIKFSAAALQPLRWNSLFLALKRSNGMLFSDFHLLYLTLAVLLASSDKSQ
jgi:hypothetical protein